MVRFVELTAPAALAPGCSARFFVGYRHGQPVYRALGFRATGEFIEHKVLR